MTFVTLGAKELLAEVGRQLDAGREVKVYNGGIVRPSKPFAQHQQQQGMEKKIEQSRQERRPAAGSRQRPASGQRAPRGSRATGSASRIGRDLLRAAYEGQVTRLAEAYPALRTFPDGDGMWLVAKSSIISGLAQKATFLVALPYKPDAGPRAWGFWVNATPARWIGARHTNFQDGSICAFSPDDGAWYEGGDLRTLLDLYSVWTLRHLHLEVFGRWPGKQYALLGADPRLQAFYRRAECHDDELCGCGSETRRYAECCKPFDMQWSDIELMSFFLRHIPGGFQSRQPPLSVVDFIEERSVLPRIADVHPLITPR